MLTTINTQRNRLKLNLVTVLPPQQADAKRNRAEVEGRKFLNFISDHALTLTRANMMLMAAAVIYTLYESEWAECPRTKRQITSALAHAFHERNSGMRRSKRYEFSRMSVEIAQHEDAKRLAGEAVRRGPTECAITYLAERFHELAPDVAKLARHFGTERSSGRRNRVRRTSFADSLRKLIEQMLRTDGTIPILAAVDMFLPGLSGAQLIQLAKGLLLRISDDGLRELYEIIARILEHREARQTGFQRALAPSVGPQ
jgi:hypothetical protein